jgi:uncharacterized glyoxalase superfamily protein PhnB
VTPYVAVKGADRFLEFVERTFDVKTSGRALNDDGTIGHAEITVGNSVLMVFDVPADWPDLPSLLSVYVEDVDEVFARAIDAGATVITELVDSRIIGDRVGRVTDPLGNIWWLQTHQQEADPAYFADPVELGIMQHLQTTFVAELTSRMKS